MNEKKKKKQTHSHKQKLTRLSEEINRHIEEYFKNSQTLPEKGIIDISRQRYILLRASSLSISFFNAANNVFKKLGSKKPDQFTRKFLFEMSHSIGVSDAKKIKNELNLNSAEKIFACGPQFFSLSGWGSVDILKDSNPIPGEDFLLIYRHNNSFEADSWIKKKNKSPLPVCIMNAGYSSGWCETSFKTPLVASEISCRGAGDKECLFIMAPPDKIEEHIEKYSFQKNGENTYKYNIETFSHLKKIEEEIEKGKKDTEAALNFIDSIIENIPLMIFVKEARELRFVKFNKAGEDLLGYNRKDLIGKNDYDLFPKKQADFFTSKDWEVLERGEVIDITEEPIDTTKGKKILHTKKVPIMDKNGNPKYLLGISEDITLRKKMEEELIETKDYLENIINTVGNPIFVKDRNHRWVLLNEAYCTFMGYPREALIGKSDFDFFPKEEAEVFWEKDEKVFQTGKPNTNEENFTSSDGLVHSILTRKELYTDNSGNEYIVGIITDITDIKKAKEKISELKKQIEFILGATHTGLDIIDSNFNILYIDPNWAKNYGDHKGRKCYDYFMGRKKPCPNCGAKKALKTKKLVISEEIMPKEKDRLFQVTSIPFQNKKGDWLAAEVHVDITERTRAEEKRIAAERKYRLIFDLSPEVIWRVNKEGQIEDINKRLYSWTGYRPEEFIGNYIFDLPILTEKSRKRIKENFTKRMKGEHIPPYELDFKTKSGEPIAGRLYATPVRDSANNIIGEIVMIPDITFEVTARKKLQKNHNELERIVAERTKRLTEEIVKHKKTEKNLKKANKELENFASTISHDLKAPLKAIEAFTAFLNESAKKKLSAEEKDYVNEISDAVTRMENMMEGLLEHTRLSNIKNRRQPVNPSELLKEVLAEFNMYIKKYDIELTVQEKSPTVICDRMKMREVFRNLIGNAIKFSININRRPKIEIGCNLKEKEVEFFVKDNGIGIKKEHQGKIFDLFRTLHPRGDYEGTGIGLANVKNIIEEFRGRIKVDSKYGEGSTFYFTIPLKKKPDIGTKGEEK